MERSPLEEVIEEVRANAKWTENMWLAVILGDAVFYLERLARIERGEEPQDDDVG